MCEIATDAVLEGGGGPADFRTSGSGRGKAVRGMRVSCAQRQFSF